MESNVVHIVMISGEWGGDTSIHSVYSSEASADKAKKELESNLSEDMIVYVETHEVFDN